MTKILALTHIKYLILNRFSYAFSVNNFYARFEHITPFKDIAPPNDVPLSFFTSTVCSTLSRVNTHKAVGSDGIPGHVLRVGAEQQNSSLESLQTFSTHL